MPFTNTTYFIAAHVEGSTRRILLTQDGGAPLECEPSGDFDGTSWTVVQSALRNSNGTLVPQAGAHGAFTATQSGGDGEGFLKLDLDKLYDTGIVPTLTADALVDTFVESGEIDLTIEDGSGHSEPVTVSLRAIKTADFRLAGNTAVPSYGGGATPNISVPTTPAEDITNVGQYTFNLLGAPATCAADGTLTLSATQAPADAATDNQALVIQHLTGTTPITSTLSVDVHVPVDCVIMVDRSGSMGASVPTGGTKWEEAKAAAELFSQLYNTALPVVDTHSGGLAAFNTISLGKFYRSGGNAITFEPFVAGTATPSYSVDAPSGGTPLGPALVASYQHLVQAPGAPDNAMGPSPWRSRHIVLLTDGMHNGSGPAPADITAVNSSGAIDVTAGNGDLPTTAVADLGITVHTVSYALTGDTNVSDLNSLADEFGGSYHHSTEMGSELDPHDLQSMFLDILAKMLPVERSVDIGSGYELTSTPIEDGVERAIFITTDAGATMTVSDTAGAVTTTGDSDANFAWRILDQPAPESYSVSGAGSGQVFVLFDLALRMKTGVERNGVGKPVKMWAQVKHGLTPVTDAEIKVRVERPGESVGEVLTEFAKSGKLARAVSRRRVSATVFNAMASMQMHSGTVSSHSTSANKKLSVQSAASLAAPPQDQKSIRRALLDALALARQHDLLWKQGGIDLVHVGNGRYEAELPADKTQDEGLYHFFFEGEGKTPAGYNFGRAKRESAFLEPTPDTESSTVTLTAGPAVTGYVPWTATAMPVSVTGKPLGPGLGHMLAFQHLDTKRQQPLLRTLDNLDGTYSTKLVLAEGDKPKVGLVHGYNRGGKQTVISNTKPTKDLLKVSVTLDAIKVLDDKDPCIFGEGELVFDSYVAPNGIPSRAVRMRVPEDGHIKANSGATLKIAKEIFSGVVVAGTSLDIALGATELDSFLFIQHNDKFARYRRKVAIQRKETLELLPGDELNDPESMADWEVSLTVKIS